MDTALYHFEVYLPEQCKVPAYEGKLKYSLHARKEAASDRYGTIDLPDVFKAANAQLIEVEFDIRRNRIIKQVWRQPLDESRDLVLVIQPDGFVRTVWVNLRSDVHRTLNPSRYARR